MHGIVWDVFHMGPMVLLCPLQAMPIIKLLYQLDLHSCLMGQIVLRAKDRREAAGFRAIPHPG